MAINYVSIGLQKKNRKALEIGTRYKVIHTPVEHDISGEFRMHAFFPATRGVEYYGTLTQIETDALMFIDVEIPEQNCTGGSRDTYGIGSSRFVQKEHLDRVREETIDISRIVKVANTRRPEPSYTSHLGLIPGLFGLDL